MADSALHASRHQQLTQTFIPLGNKPFVLVVAQADASLENGLPIPSALAACYAPGTTGLQLHRGTWHENLLPAEDEVTLVVSSRQAFTKGHQAPQAQQQLECLVLDVEKYVIAEAGGYEVEVNWPAASGTDTLRP